MNFHGNDLESSNGNVTHFLTLDVGRLPGIKTKDSIRGLDQVIEESSEKKSLGFVVFFGDFEKRLVTKKHLP